MRLRNRVPLLPVLLFLLVASSGIQARDAQAQSPSALTSPEQLFGFQMGADRKLASWDKLVEY